MPSYALLGATGSTGTAILRSLLSSPPKELTLNIFVRSKSKLLTAFPDLETTTAFKLKIFEGSPTSDPETTRECLKGVDVVFAVIGTNEAKKGMSVVEDAARAMIAALDANRTSEGEAYKPPTIIQLRSATLNPVFRAKASAFAANMAGFAFAYVYADLRRAGALYEAAAAQTPKLLDIIYVDPPSIHDPDGVAGPTGYKLVLEPPQLPTLNYADLGAAFVEVAGRRAEFAGKGVAVTPTGKVNETWPKLMGYMVTGLKSRLWG